MAVVSLPTLDNYAHAKWDLALFSGGVELELDLISASFTINNGDVNNPFNLNCNNTANIKIENDFDLVKGQEIEAIAYLLDENEQRTQTTISLGTYYVDNGDFDEYQNSYSFVSSENKYNINCPYIDFTDSQVVSQDSMSMNFAALVNLEFTTAGFEAPLAQELESEGISVNVDPTVIDYTQYTLIGLLNAYNSIYCNVQDGFDGATSQADALPYDLASAGSPQKSYGDTSGVDYVSINFNYVNTTTEVIEADLENGTDEHTVTNRSTQSSKYYFSTDYQGETAVSGNGFQIEFPFPIGANNATGAQNKQSILEAYNDGNIANFLTRFETAYFPTASIGYILSPEIMARINHNTMFYDTSAVDSEDLAEHLVDGEYVFDLENPSDLTIYNQITYPFTMMCMQYSITFDGSASLSVSSGNSWNVSSLTSSTSSGSVSVISDGAGNNVAQVMAMLGRLENSVTWWNKNGLNLNNFGTILANADYLNMGSKLFQEIQAQTITTEYLKASEGNIDWLTVLSATIETAMIKDGAITHAKIGTEAVEASNIKDATITGAQIANSTITNAHIANISADKINAGTIYTNNVTIQSQEGNFLISDNTLQIKDNNDVVRVQVGQTGASAPYDYDLVLADASGNIMWNASGLQEDGVPNGLIKDAMVANNAAIQAGKLDIDSLFTVINNDNTHTIYGSKIYMNNEDASLEVVLSEIRTEIGSGSGEFYMDLTVPPTLDNYPAILWSGSTLLYPDTDVYPNTNVYPGSNGSGTPTYEDHIGAKAYLTDSFGNVRSWMFTKDEHDNYYWQETTGTLDDTILHRLAVVEIDTTKFESRFSEMTVNQDGIYNFWSMFHQDSSQIIQEVANDRLISAINQTAEQVSINASKISLEGLVTVNGKFTIDQYGSMTATGGTIANFTINNTAIYNGTNSMQSTTQGVYIGTDGIRQYNSANAFVNIQNGVLTANGVELEGSLHAYSTDENFYVVSIGNSKDSSDSDYYTQAQLSYQGIWTEYRPYSPSASDLHKYEAFMISTSSGCRTELNYYPDYTDYRTWQRTRIYPGSIEVSDVTMDATRRVTIGTDTDVGINIIGNLGLAISLWYDGTVSAGEYIENGYSLSSKYATISSLSGYVTNTSLTQTLSDYVTFSDLSTTLDDYVTDTSLATTLSDYVTDTSLATVLDDYATISSLSAYFPFSNIKQYYNSSVPVFSGGWTSIGTIENLMNISTYGNNVLLVITATNYNSRSTHPSGIHVQPQGSGIGSYSESGMIGHIQDTNSSHSYNDLTLVCRASSYDSNEVYVTASSGSSLQVRIYAIILDD